MEVASSTSSKKWKGSAVKVIEMLKGKQRGGVVAAAAFKLQSTGFDTLGQAKNIYLIRDDVKSHDILPGSCSKTTETRRTTPTTTRQKSAIWAIIAALFAITLYTKRIIALFQKILCPL